MKASELRIGNLVEYKRSGALLTVDCELLQEIVDGAINYKPIPLTEEWLLRFGFKCVWSGQGEGSTFKLSDIYLHSHDFVKNFYLVEFQGKDIKIKIDNVHKLQNLYFSLTGKELEY
jgi:hypothetical protein